MGSSGNLGSEADLIDQLRHESTAFDKIRQNSMQQNRSVNRCMGSGSAGKGGEAVHLDPCRRSTDEAFERGGATIRRRPLATFEPLFIAQKSPRKEAKTKELPRVGASPQGWHYDPPLGVPSSIPYFAKIASSVSIAAQGIQSLEGMELPARAHARARESIKKPRKSRTFGYGTNPIVPKNKKPALPLTRRAAFCYDLRCKGCW